MTEKRFASIGAYKIEDLINNNVIDDIDDIERLLNKLSDDNEQLKKGMIKVIDRYIKNVECNPPSSVRTYRKIKGALINIREDLRDLIGDLE